MEIQVARLAEWLEVRLRGRLDADHAGHVEAELEELIRGGGHCLRLHLGEVSFISSAGVSVLVSCHKTVASLGGAFAIVEPSAAVRSVLELTGLTELLRLAPAPAAAGEAAPRQRRFGPLTLADYQLPGGALTCTLAGDPSWLASAAFGPRDTCEVELPRDALAVGLGAFGRDFEDCRYRFGELLAAGGAVAYLPGDRAAVPDYLLAAGSLVPRVQALYLALCRGSFARCARFEAAEERGHVPLSALVRAALELEGAPAIGLVVIAESAGLVGASLRHSPAAAAPAASRFIYPEIRDWLSFTPERAFDRSLALIAGIAATAPDAALARMLRPLGREPLPAAHLHAAAITFRALPKGALSLEQVVATLFAEQKLLGILHLLHDDREIAGAGESLLVRGAIWTAPIVSVKRLPRTPGGGP